MTVPERREVDALRARCDALAAENETIADHLGRALQTVAQMAARLELLDCAYGRLLIDVRVLRGGHVHADAARQVYDVRERSAATLDAEMLPNRPTRAA